MAESEPSLTRTAAVIFGAGASHDSVRFEVEATDANATPPLTDQIFDTSFSRIISRYPDASALAATIKIRLAQGEALERVLRSIADAPAKNRKAQFRQIPLYLRDLFEHVSEAYTRNPTNYSHVVHELLANFTRVAFITLNYDCLLDRVLSAPAVGAPIVDLDGYIRESWMLVKIHGSVNWVRTVEAQRVSGLKGWVPAHDSRYLGALAGLGDAPMTDIVGRQITLLEGAEMARNEMMYYPAIVMPTEGKYQLACPDDHVRQLEDFLGRCTNVLVIGASGKDQDLIELLRRSLGQVVTFHVVEKGDAECERRFNQVRQLAFAPFKKAHHQGFGQFLEAGGLQEFIENGLR